MTVILKGGFSLNILAINDSTDSLSDIDSLIMSVEPTASVRVFRNVKDAVEFAMNNKIDIVILNALFDSVSGIEIAARLSKIYPTLNIIFYNQGTALMKEAFSVRASGYMICPITMEKVKNEMTNLRYAV